LKGRKTGVRDINGDFNLRGEGNLGGLITAQIERME
jgi:hypothetical protein